MLIQKIIKFGTYIATRTCRRNICKTLRPQRPSRRWKSKRRETVARVAAAAVARQWLGLICGIEVTGWVQSIDDVVAENTTGRLKRALIEQTPVRCPDDAAAQRMIKLIESTRSQGDTIGGRVNAQATGVPSGWGSPVLTNSADEAKACLSLPACKGFEIGSGFLSTTMLGSEHNDPIKPEGATLDNEKISPVVFWVALLQALPLDIVPSSRFQPSSSPNPQSQQRASRLNIHQPGAMTHASFPELCHSSKPQFCSPSRITHYDNRCVYLKSTTSWLRVQSLTPTLRGCMTMLCHKPLGLPALPQPLHSPSEYRPSNPHSARHVHHIDNGKRPALSVAHQRLLKHPHRYTPPKLRRRVCKHHRKWQVHPDKTWPRFQNQDPDRQPSNNSMRQRLHHHDSLAPTASVEVAPSKSAHHRSNRCISWRLSSRPRPTSEAAAHV